MTDPLQLNAAETEGKLNGARQMVNVLLDLLDSLPDRTRAAFARVMERELVEIEAEHVRALDAIVRDAQKQLQNASKSGK